MFKLPFRIKLSKHGWLEASKEGGNQSQTLRRIKVYMKQDLADMTLLYKKLPKEKRDQLYNQENFSDIFELLLEHDNYDDPVKSSIAVSLVEKSLDYFKVEFSEQNKNTQVISSVIIDQLDKAKEICKDIVYKQKFKNIQHELPKEGLRYLASWSEIVVREKGNLESFLAEVLDLIPDKLNIHYSYYDEH